MGRQEDNEKAHGKGKADREAGKSDKTNREREETVAAVVTGGLSTLLPGGRTEKDKSYSAGYHEKDKKKN